MNANEMADRLENELNIFENRFVCDAATMLRQQQAEIDQLRSLIAPKEIPANVRIMYQIFDGKEWLNMGEINER